MEKPYVRLEFTTSDLMDEHEALEEIADRVAHGDTSGTITVGSGSTTWEMREIGPSVEIDRRQRLAAVALMMGMDLPQEMAAWASSMMEAAQLCPGMNTGEIPNMSPNGRREALEFARRLIDEMLAETL